MPIFMCLAMFDFVVAYICLFSNDIPRAKFFMLTSCMLLLLSILIHLKNQECRQSEEG